MGKETVHSYTTFCSKKIYNKYGQLQENLLPRHIFTIGLELPEGVRGDNGNIHHYGVVVMSPERLDGELEALFPDITTEWLYAERTRDEKPIKDKPSFPFAVRI